MAQEVLLPQMGESIAEGTITSWLKNIGDTVERDEPLYEMSTDKVDAEIPSPISGTLLEIKVEPGQTVAVNTVVALIGEAGEDTQAAAPVSQSEEVVEPVKVEPATEATVVPISAAVHAPKPAGDVSSLEERRRTRSSPVVRKIAREHGVDIAVLSGSGIAGRVTKKDILAFIDGGAPAPAAQAAASGSVSLQPGVVEIPAAYRPQVFPGDRVEEMSKMRSKIAEHMVLSRQISSHVSSVWDVDYTKVAKLRAQYKASWLEQQGVKLTFTGFIMKACVDALKVFPELNASLDGNRIIYHRNVNLGLAVALDWGLLVPVVKAAEELNTLGLMRRANDLAERARGKKLQPDEVQQGTFTITNPGVFGSMFGTPVINQPQVGILGVGAIEKRPVVIDDMIGIRTKGFLSLSFDHRLVDGAVADKFMARVKRGIEDFDEAELA
ncbi:MAG: dihydrolipoamide acetyltransferase family protein [Myxococcota bacterium]|nr:dihydrolipoamide acetyltransferase family protein [Myxococcota bacterium]